MIDIKLDNNHDVFFKNFDFLLCQDAEQVRQQIEIKLKLWVGEWFLDTEFGTPYLQSILGKQLTLSGAIAAIKKSILEVSGVRQILEFNFNFDNINRKLNIDFTVDTLFGIVEVST
jgi:hypothetical protein